MCVCQIAADLVARRIARFNSGRQADPCPHEQRLNGRHGQAQHAPDLHVGHPAHLAHQQRRTLLIRQPPDVDDQPAQRLAPLALQHRVAAGGRGKLQRLRSGRHRAPEFVHAAVVRDPIQPGAQAQLAAIGQQARICADEHVLEHVLGVGMLPREHLAHVGEQPRAVAIVNDPERVLVAAAEEPD